VIAFLRALPALITALPILIEQFIRLMALLERFAQWASKNNLNAFLSEVEGAVDQLEKARTPDEKLNAARSIGSLIRKL
jgi:hypothetical protein